MCWSPSCYGKPTGGSPRHIGVRLRYRRPYRGRPWVNPAMIAATLAQHLAVGHVSAIAGLTGSIEHWTVVRAVRPKTILLFDSDDLKRLPLDPHRRGRGK